MNLSRLFVIAGILLMLFMSSCSSYQKLLKSDDNERKFEQAIAYYEAGKYGRTIALLSDIIPHFRGTSRAETINYYYAWAHYKFGDYTMASFYFRSFANAFPQSEHAEEFFFMSAYCKYLESPRPNLDQTVTMEAIRDLQSFINRFPSSERVEEANNLIDELRSKLETKRFEKALMYMRISDFIAANTTFENLIRDFPDTQYREQALFQMIQSHFNYASRSIPQRQIERFEDTLTAYRRFVRFFPDSELMPRAERLRQSTEQQLAMLRASLEESATTN